MRQGGAKRDSHEQTSYNCKGSAHLGSPHPLSPRYQPEQDFRVLKPRGQSSIYRIHGSNQPDTIGAAVSSSCIWMTNRDVVDLYDRVKIGTKVVVLQ